MAVKKNVIRDNIRPKRRGLKSSDDSYHHGDLRATLIQNAVRLLKTKSPNELSLRELARISNVSSAAPFRHFKDRIDLLAAISQQGFEIQLTYMQKAIANAKGDPKKIFFDSAKAYFQMGYLHPQHFKLMFGSEVSPSEEQPALAEAAIKTFKALKDVVVYGQSKKFLGAGDPYHFALICWATVHGFTSLYAENHLDWLGVTQENATEMLQQHMEQFLRGARENLSATKSGKLFQTPRSKMLLQMMESFYPEGHRLAD